MHEKKPAARVDAHEGARFGSASHLDGSGRARPLIVVVMGGMSGIDGSQGPSDLLFGSLQGSSP